MELAAGRLWRAKEILRGRLSNSDYDCDLFARYADVLHRMGDEDEAGRYYFLSARRDGIAGDLAHAFLTRRAQWTPLEIWGGMPVAAVKLSDEGMPAIVRSELLSVAGNVAALSDLDADLKYRRRVGRRNRQQEKTETASPKWHRAIEATIVITISLVFLLGVAEATRLLILGLKSVVSFRFV